MKKTSGKEKVVHFSSNTARAEVKEKSESSVIWHKVKPFSHHDPKKQNTVTHRKQKKNKKQKTWHFHSLHHAINHANVYM